MGTSFTIASPIKVAKYGISSVISCVDDVLIEKMRKFYCKVVGQDYTPLEKNEHDVRARRITAYLNLLDQIVLDQFEKLKLSAFEIGSEITRYFELLADSSPLKNLYRAMLTMTNSVEKQKAQEELRNRIKPGSIDINIMTKLDRTNYDRNGQPLPSEFSDALSALRGYANSILTSAVVFSAGFNGRLYGYVEQFKDFHADEEGFIKKKLIIKVSDYRSAYTQGKFFAKKGLWVSEYRVESGLNCGGHAFTQGGSLMGPNLEEFKEKRHELISDIFQVYTKALIQKGRKAFPEPHEVQFTAQGGIGTAREHNFLLDHYQLDAAGWGTPFLLVPEATTTDPETLEKLCEATSEDLYLSDVSPLDVPFNNLRTSASELTKVERIRANRPGSPCMKGYLASNTEFTPIPVCTASRFYQKKKLDECRAANPDPDVFQKACEKILAKSCLCSDLGGAAIIAFGLQEPGELQASPAVCPGPNLAHFSRVVSLKEMVDHIYGRISILNDTPRSNMFVAELRLNVDYLVSEIKKSLSLLNDQRIKYLKAFKGELLKGIAYYEKLVPHMKEETTAYLEHMRTELQKYRAELEALASRYTEIFR
jgi:hypothetical protein